MADKRAPFEAVMSGISVVKALEGYRRSHTQEVEPSGGDIELF
jgi:hypothetical protein